MSTTRKIMLGILLVLATANFACFMGTGHLLNLVAALTNLVVFAILL
jgi:hypothetical protein